MVHRLALTIGGLGALGVLGLAIAVGGNPLSASGASPTDQPGVDALVADDPSVRTVVDTVYVKPADAASVSDDRRPGDGSEPTSSPAPTTSPGPASTPEPTASPEATFEAFDDHGGDRNDDRSGHRDGDADDDRSGSGGGEFDDDRSGHRDGDDHDDDRSGHGGGDDDHSDDD